MKRKMQNKGCLLILFGILLFFSCNKQEYSEIAIEDFDKEGLSLKSSISEAKSQNSFNSCYFNEIIAEDDITVSPCASTDFGEVIFSYFLDFLSDPYFDFNTASYYLNLNRKYVTHYRGENYFGENGEYTKLAEKRFRELTDFWKLNRNIILNGQHTASLNDRETLTDMIESFDNTVSNRIEAYAKADLLIELNSKSSTFPESPFFAMDGFTRPNGLLVIGDGLIETIAAIEVDANVVFTGILSHEWWHQAQYEYAGTWLEIDQFDDLSERSRFIELEADFAAAYFMSHKRGATYNWKRIEDFFEVSYNIGDCLVESNSHHGTPQQRLRAARLGNELAASMQKKGKILSAPEVHQFFLENLAFIL